MLAEIKKQWAEAKELMCWVNNRGLSVHPWWDSCISFRAHRFGLRNRMETALPGLSTFG